MNRTYKGGFEPLTLSGATYLGHVLASLIHNSQISGDEIVHIYDYVDNKLARDEIEAVLANEMRNQSVINIKELAKKHKIKDELKKIKNNKEISSIKKELKEPLSELLGNEALEDNLLHHNYKKKVILTEEDEDLYAKSIFSERLLNKIALNINEVVEVVDNINTNELDENQKRMLKIIQNFVHLYKYFGDNKSHFEYDKNGNRVFIVEGKLKTRSLSKSVSNRAPSTTAKARKFRFKTPKQRQKTAAAAKLGKTFRRRKTLSFEKIGVMPPA